MAELSSALQNPQALITLGVLGLAVVLFITGLIAPELTGLLSLSLLIATGVLNPQEALAASRQLSIVAILPRDQKIAPAAIASGPCLLYTSPSPRDLSTSRMPSSA